MTGKAIGLAHLRGQGLSIVFASDSADFFDVMVRRTGEIFFVHRSKIEWRKK